jgi:Transposase DDE domain group 1
MLLAQAERRLGIADQLARVIPDDRDAVRVTHLLPDILRARIFAIACGYEDADDLDRLRFDPALKLACGRLPDTGRDLCSQPTISRWENAPSLRDLIRLIAVMVDLYYASYPKPPDAVTLDIDDTVDVVHGHQQLSLFNAHYDERCFLPLHVYDTATSRPVAVLLRPGKTPSGTEIRGHLRRLVRRIRRHWPQTRITIRGDGHYGRPEVMEWCDNNGVDFIFGLSGNAVLDRLVDATADDIRTRRALDQKPCLRGFAETSYRAKSWKTDRRACARIEATTKGARHPFRRDQRRDRIGRAYLRGALLRPRAGRELDQIAQGPACLRSHQLPQPTGQSDAADPAHRRLLAYAHRP